MKFRIALAALGLALATACDGGGKGEDGPPLVESYNVSCSGDGNTVTFKAGVSGAPHGGVVFMQETASEYVHNGSLLQYWEEHDLQNNAAGDGLQLTIDAGAADTVRNQASLFSCEGHFEEQATDGSAFMTYVFGVKNAGGDVVDCLAGGNDPQGLIAGDYDNAQYDSYNGEIDLSSCVAAQ